MRGGQNWDQIFSNKLIQFITKSTQNHNLNELFNDKAFQVFHRNSQVDIHMDSTLSIVINSNIHTGKV